MGASARPPGSGVSGLARALCLLSITSLTGCASLPLPFGRRAPEPAATPAAAETDTRATVFIEPPVALTGDDDYVVRVVAGSVACSGTLIDEDLVLTAHHCVSQRDRVGDYVAGDVEPSALRVELGGDYLPWGEIGVRALVTPPCGYAGGAGDIAILVLERRLVGIATAAPRLDREPQEGEALEPVGFGRCATSGDGVRRHERQGGRVGGVFATRFRMPAAICPGDSGGPMLNRETGEIVGVISSSVMDGDEATTGRSELTRLDAWRPLFASARQIADGLAPAELPPIDRCPAR